MSFPRGNISHVLSQLIARGIENVSYVTPLAEVSWKLVPSFLQTLCHVPFPSADFALNPLAIINHNHKYDYMLILVSPSRKSLNIRAVLGIVPKQTYGEFAKRFTSSCTLFCVI